MKKMQFETISQNKFSIAMKDVSKHVPDQYQI